MLTVEKLQQIASENGLAHARFCLEQEATQVGRDNLKSLFDALEQWENVVDFRKC